MRRPVAPPRLPATIVAGALALVLALVASPDRADASASGACDSPEDGVTVVVDFRGFRDEVVVRCAPAPVESGYDALSRAGFSFTPTQRHPGFLCRIEGHPADDPCATTPPPDAYWGYWRAEMGGDWRYSQYGPATSNPPPGPVEGWAFSTGDDQPPRTAPPAASPEPEPEPAPSSSSPAPPPASSPPPSPPPPAEPEPEPAATSAAPPSPDAPAETSDPAAASPRPTTAPTPAGPDTPTPSGTPPEPTATPTPTDEPSAAASPTDTRTPDDLTAAAAPPDADGGSPLPTVLGLAAVAGVAGAALVARRRRSTP